MNQKQMHPKHHALRGRPYWKRVHHDWKFWVAVVLMLAAMTAYLRSNDLSVRPRNQLQQNIP